MSWLLIDNSNSRTKFALGDSERLLGWRAVITTADISAETLEDITAGLGFSAVAIASVVPAKAEILRGFFATRGPVHLLDHTSPIGMRIDCPEPARIGADRLANAAGVEARHRLPAIVIDLGTATTFDVISEDPAYCGGVIAPGLGAVTGYLPRNTAQLPEIELTEPATAIGKTTVEAMQSGAVFGYRGLVREILARIRMEMAGDPVVVATGGDARWIAAGLPEIDEVDPDITLDGLRQVAARVFGSAD